MSKVNWRAKNDYEFMENFKLLASGFKKIGMKAPLDIEKLVKCKY